MLLPGPRHQAGMGAGHPRAGKHQHPHQRGFHKPRLPGSPLSLPTTTPQAGVVGVHALGAAAFVSRWFLCKRREQRSWGQGVAACLAAGSSRTGVPNKQPYREAQEGSPHMYCDLVRFQEMLQ